MIDFSQFELENGLKVIVHEDFSTPLVAVNMLYKVGAKDESPQKTGFAHLFEHLMFGGSANVPSFDEAIQIAGGENNAFTNNDITNFYDVLPAKNIETAFWLESDRMLNLNFNQRSLEIQQKVVVEEFKETCLNQPYGDVWHQLSGMAYKVHPYRWPTIGITPTHIEEATLDDVKDFFYKYYRPNNAILVVAGNITLEKVKQLSQKWFADIPRGTFKGKNIPQEPIQKKLEHKIHVADVPVDAIYLAFHVPGRRSSDYYTVDLISDVLGNGPSSRLYRKLLKEKRLFNTIDAYITGNVHPGLLIIEGKPAKGVSLEEGKEAIWLELEELKRTIIDESELLKYKNKVESALVFSEMSILNKAINLAFYESLGNVDLINQEKEIYQKISPENIQYWANTVFTKNNCSELFYTAK